MLSLVSAQISEFKKSRSLISSRMSTNSRVMLERSLLTTSNSNEADHEILRLQGNFCTVQFLS